MAVEFVKQDYTGKIREVTIGAGDKAVKVGGANSYPFYLFEGALPNPPRIAWEVWDAETDQWPEACKEPFADVLTDPPAWAKKLVEKHGAEMIALKLVSIDPNGKNADAKSAVETVKKVLAAVSVPVLVFGVNSVEKDAEVLRQVAEACEGRNLVLGPVQEQNHKALGAGAIGFKHTVLASTPIDVNLAKQLNTLLGNLGVKEDKLLMDPTTGGLGYGIEYTYSVMERDRMAALVQQDEKMQQPLVCNLAPEVWKTKEAKLSAQDDPKMGEAKTRGITLEAMTATLLLLAGADVLVMRHPEAVAKIKTLIKELSA
ncbi:MAG: acetyl-CoA decarbonylase/synthase complex subunit delta [Deltaproteobacteria bacterium RBG_13_61_14]|nr:MAG: acetyl-CoA decarbonylase/synthase complex subunit delta [Deltaproteobacteria bacterium RBG_13_61_14]